LPHRNELQENIMGAGVSQQVLNRAALKRLRALQADINATYVGRSPATYQPATRSAYGRVVCPGVTFSVSVIRASNGEAFMQLIALKASPNRWINNSMDQTDLAFALDMLATTNAV
jgi:hypothetical protein